MTATRLQDNTFLGRDATEDIDRLRIVERSEWVETISASLDTSASEWLTGGLTLAILASSLASVIWFFVKRSFWAVAVAAVNLALWAFFGSFPIAFGTIAVIVLGLGIAWSLYWASMRAKAPLD